jgi:WD40 repeat protein
MRAIFISHAEADASVAIEIARGLEAAGYTTWLYEAHGLPGVSYLEQTGSAIESARIFLLLISPASLGSKQVDSEVVRAHESARMFVPVLLGLTHAEFQQRRPAWRQAVGSATSIQVPAAGVTAVLPRLLLGLKALGVEPEARPQAIPSAAPSRPIAGVDGFQRGEGRLRGAPTRLYAWAAIGFALVLAMTAAWIAWHRARPWAQPRETPLTSFPPEYPVLSAALSPSGDYLAYADTSGYYLLSIKTRQVSALPAVEGIPRPTGELLDRSQLAWLPDGKSLVIGTSIWAQETTMDSLWTVSLMEGRVRRIRDGAWGAAVSPAGTIAFLTKGEPGSAIWLSDADGSNPRRVTPATGEWHDYQFLAWSPREERLAYRTSCGSESLGTFQTVIETCDLRGKNVTRIHSDPLLGAGWDARRGLCWLPDGRLLFYLPDSTQSQDIVDLWAVPVDTRTGAVRGRMSRVLRGVGSYISDLTCSADGKRLGLVRWRTQFDVHLAELKDGGSRLGAVRRLTLDDHGDFVLGWTPDSKAVVFLSARSNPANLYRQGIHDRVATPLLESPAMAMLATFTSDGAWILYRPMDPDPNSRTVAADIMRVPVSGGPAQVVAKADSSVGQLECGSRPGAPCIIATEVGNERVFSEFNPLTGARKEMTRVRLSRHRLKLWWYISPDGLQVVVDTDDGPLIVDLTTGARQRPEPQGWEDASFLGWAADGGTWFGATDGKDTEMLHVDPSGRTRSVGRLELGPLAGLYASPDGRYLAYDRRTHEANAWLIEGF